MGFIYIFFNQDLSFLWDFETEKMTGLLMLLVDETRGEDERGGMSEGRRRVAVIGKWARLVRPNC